MHNDELPCAECRGSGKVVYDEKHPIVKLKLAKSGTYICPMCSGSGILILEKKEEK